MKSFFGGSFKDFSGFQRNARGAKTAAAGSLCMQTPGRFGLSGSEKNGPPGDGRKKGGREDG